MKEHVLESPTTVEFLSVAFPADAPSSGAPAPGLPPGPLAALRPPGGPRAANPPAPPPPPLVYTATVEEDQGTVLRKVVHATAWGTATGDVAFQCGFLAGAAPRRVAPGWAGVAPAPGGAHLVTAEVDPDDVDHGEELTLHVVSATTGEPLCQLGSYPPGKPLWPPAFTRDGRLVAVNLGTRVDVYSVYGPGGGPLLSVTEHKGGITHCAFTADGASVLTSSLDRTAKSTSVAKGPPAAFTLNHTEAVSMVAAAADGKNLLTLAPLQRRAAVWEASTGRMWHALASKFSAIRAASLSPDGAMAVTFADRDAARVWDVDQGSEVCALGGTDPPAMAAHAWAPSGRYLVVAAERAAGGGAKAAAQGAQAGAAVQVFDTRTGKEVSAFPTAAPPTALCVVERPGLDGSVCFAVGDASGGVYLLLFHER